MIAMLTGKLAQQSLDRIVIDVQGVGYGVLVPIGTTGRLKPQEDERVTVYIHTHVREDALMLFGFASQEERHVFEKLIGVTGVGAKLALAILSALGPMDLVQAVETNDVKALTNVSGIGKKTAQRLILELKSRIDDFTLDAISPSQSAQSQLTEDLKSALKNMGIDANVIDTLIEQLAEDIAANVDIGELIRKAFRLLR